MSNRTDEKNREGELIDVAELLSDYLRIFRKMWGWVIIFALAGAALFYVNARMTYAPMYTASATFTINMQDDFENVSGSSDTFFNNSTAEQMAKTFPYILTSGVLKRQVSEDMGMPVYSSIEASAAENTNLFTISVRDSDPGMAYAVLLSVIENYPEVSEVIVGKTSMQMLDETGIPPHPDNAKDFEKSASKGAVLGVLLVAMWAAAVVVTRKTIRKESDIQKYMNTKCLGSVPHIVFKRRSVQRDTKLILTDPSLEDKLQEPFRIIRNKIEYHARSYKHKVFLVTSAIAGEGKSTVAVNLALSLAQAGHKVALVDCDLRHPSDREVLGLEDGMGLSEVLQYKCKMKDITITSKELGFDKSMKLVFIPGGETLRDGSGLLGTEGMGRMIQSLKEKVDYIILDSAPAGLLTDAVVLAQHADGAIFVVRKDCARVDFIMDAMENLSESKIQFVGGILNGD